MSVLFVCYPKCGTCRKAEKWLKDQGLAYEKRDISIDQPTEAELREWKEKSGLPLKKFFNTSGQIYRQNQLKDKLPGMTEDQQFALLAESGMLVKRPILVDGDTVLVGFKEKDYEDYQLKS